MACALSPFYKTENAFLTQFRIFEILFFKKKITLYTTFIALTVSILTRYDMVKTVKTLS